MDSCSKIFALKVLELVWEVPGFFGQEKLLHREAESDYLAIFFQIDEQSWTKYTPSSCLFYKQICFVVKSAFADIVTHTMCVWSNAFFYAGSSVFVTSIPVAYT